MMMRHKVRLVHLSLLSVIRKCAIDKFIFAITCGYCVQFSQLQRYQLTIALIIEKKMLL